MARRSRRLLLVLPLALALVGIAPPGTPEPSAADAASAQPAAPPSESAMAGYDPLRAGHPLRLVAYALHPVGVILDYAVFRPAYWLGSHEPLRTLFGRER